MVHAVSSAPLLLTAGGQVDMIEDAETGGLVVPVRAVGGPVNPNGLGLLACMAVGGGVFLGLPAAHGAKPTMRVHAETR